MDVGHRRQHHTSAVAAATARRDELQQLLDQEKDRLIDNQAVLAQQPDVSYSSKPAAHEVRIRYTEQCVLTEISQVWTMPLAAFFNYILRCKMSIQQKLTCLEDLSQAVLPLIQSDLLASLMT